MNCYLTDTVNRQLAQLAADQPLWVALSGGLDSCVLLHLLASQPALRERLSAIHVHHGLSANADRWASFCHKLCEESGIRLVCERITVDAHRHGVEQAARNARYQAFDHHLADGDVLLTGHHADDQIETFLLRWLRGAGLSGLSAIPQQRRHGRFKVLRPLLDVERQQLEEYAAQQHLIWVEDESNQDRRYDRNWLRRELLPPLWQRFPGRKAAVLRSIEQLQQDREVLDSLLQPLQQQCCDPCDWPLTANSSLCLERLLLQPARLQPYLIRQWLAQHQLQPPSAIQLQRIFAEIIPAAADKQPLLQLGQFWLQRFNGQLYLHYADQGLLPELTVSDVQLGQHAREIPLPDGYTRIRVRQQAGAAGLKPGHYQLIPAAWCQGLTIRPAGRPAKTLKHLWQENRIPPWLRAGWPCLQDAEGRLAAVAGLAVDEHCWVADGLQLSYQSL